MRRKNICCLDCASALFVATAVLAMEAAAGSPPNLYTPGNKFTSDSHYVSTTVFTWFSSDLGHMLGPWRPVEGRSTWTGEPDWWQSQIKQMMAANIDVIQVEYFVDRSGSTPPNLPWYDQHVSNLLEGLHDLRAQGYNVPKVAPFLDTGITTDFGWTPGTGGQPVNLATSAGRDAFVQAYTNFYNLYYNVNPDANADSYIAQIDGRVVLDAYHLIPQWVLNPSSLTRTHVQSRLAGALGGQHALFANLPANGVFMINNSTTANFTFADEKLTQFERNAYYDIRTATSGRQAAQVKGGYWDQNIRDPGYFMPRAGGANYHSAWTQVQNDRAGGLKHVNIESWNEYDEGSGIFATDPGAPYRIPANTNNDTWSTTNDPFEYIKTTAAGARLFNDTTDGDAKILWHNIPGTMQVGQTGTYQVVVRNEGDLSWTGAAGFQFGEAEYLDPVWFSAMRFPIDDATNEISTYGGVFRGRPITFDVQVTAPLTPGTYTTHWGMLQAGVGWFGEQLAVPITVVIPEPGALTLLVCGLLGLLGRIWKKRK